jgi:alcohol dehydrogenase class IV
MLAREALRLLSDNLLRVLDQPQDRDGARRDAARRASGGRRLCQRAGGGGACSGLSARRPFSRAARGRQCTDAGAGAAAQSARRHAAVRGAGTLLDPGLEPLGQQAQAQGFITALETLAAAAGVPQRLSQVGVAPGDLDLLAAEAMKQERLLINNPCPLDQADARRLYESVL